MAIPTEQDSTSVILADARYHRASIKADPRTTHLGARTDAADTALPVSTPKGPPDFQDHGTRESVVATVVIMRAHATRCRVSRRLASAGRRTARQRRLPISGFLFAGGGGGGSSSRTLGLSLAR